MSSNYTCEYCGNILSSPATLKAHKLKNEKMFRSPEKSRYKC